MTKKLHTIHVDAHDGSQRYTYEFITPQSGRIFVDQVIDSQPVKWRTSTNIVTPTHIISCDILEELMELPTPNKIMAKVFDIVNDAPRSTKRSVPKDVPSDYISLTKICTDLKIEPRVARSILRRLKTPKPPQGWVWPPSEVKAIIRLIGDHINE